jgi:hypothetical protein
MAIPKKYIDSIYIKERKWIEKEGTITTIQDSKPIIIFFTATLFQKLELSDKRLFVSLPSSPDYETTAVFVLTTLEPTAREGFKLHRK